MPPSLSSLLLFLPLLSLPLPTASQNLTDPQLSTISTLLALGATHSWELGTRAQSILNLNLTSYSVYTSAPLPPPSTPVPSALADAASPFFDIPKSVVAGRGASNGNITGPQPLIQDGAAADPASIGVSVLLANWTGRGRSDGLDYAGAAKDQLDFLMFKVPRTSDGAISHRVAEVQLWSDFVYMVPPFLAYYGVLQGNRTLLEEAYTQIKLYRNYLRDSSGTGLWRHVLLGSETQGMPANDPGFWSTGNGWAAAGMLRVFATIANSQFSNSMKSEKQDLLKWTQEIHDAMYTHLDSSTLLFPNYANDSSSFLDASSTALLASTVYRLALLGSVYKHLPVAERTRVGLLSSGDSGRWDFTTSGVATSTSASASASASGNSSASATGSLSSFTSVPFTLSSSLPPSSTATSPSSTPSSTASFPTSTAFPSSLHFTPAGWLTPVVNPLSYAQEGTESPEGQAFVIDMQAAWRDWLAAGGKGANGARGRGVGVGWFGLAVGVVLGAVLVVG